MQFWIQFWILLRYFQTCLHNLKLWFWPVVFFERISKLVGQLTSFLCFILRPELNVELSRYQWEVRTRSDAAGCYSHFWICQLWFAIQYWTLPQTKWYQIFRNNWEIAADGSHDMIETVSIENLPGGAVAVQFRFLVEGSFLRTCDLDGLFCVNDFGMFPPAIARLLLHSKVQPVSYIYYRTGLLLVL